MCPTPVHADPITEPWLGLLVRCERVEAGAHAALIRVTLALGGLAPSAAAGARLVVDDLGTTRRCEPLPAPLPADAATVTLGFAATTTATPLGLELCGQSLLLAQHEARSLRAPPAPPAQALMPDRAPPALQPPGLDGETPARGPAPEPPAPDRGCQPPNDALRAVDRRLRMTQARLEASRSACLLVELERDEALCAVARAEAAAHDASARAETLARRLIAGGHRPRRSSRRAAGAACALACAALAVAILAWPSHDGDGDRGGGGVAAAQASDRQTRPHASPSVDPLAARLQIPADYLALYRRAAARYGLDWTRLAAVGAIESGHGQAPVAGIATGANQRGASGPAQFLPGTWERFGLDGDGDGSRDPHDAADAIPAMASYLRASGAPQDWRGALRSYNHSDAYVSAVESLAARLRSDAT